MKTKFINKNKNKIDDKKIELTEYIVKGPEVNEIYSAWIE